MIATVLWNNFYDQSTELCRVLRSEGGFALEGIVLVPIEGDPARVDYRVDVDGAWRTRETHLSIQSRGETKELSLGCDDSARWTLDREHQAHLDGCIDVDLRVTAATNTLPIRRLAPEVGEIVETRAAWVGFPELDVVASDQTYERLNETTYRYRSGDFVADLEVSAEGIVLTYGGGFWTAIAHREVPIAPPTES